MMGNKSSNKASGSSSAESAKSKKIPQLAEYIKSDKCKRIVLMLGAGVSTAAGIPDFRSPKTGLYANLQRLNLPHPEAVFEIGFFRRNPVPFYTLARELYPGKFRPTLTHSFIRLLAQHDLLHMCFTQNIDTLERQAGVPDDKIIEAHGSFASSRCIECLRPYDNDDMKIMVECQDIPHCHHCENLVKPEIVFFGEALPPKFVNSIGKVSEADLLLIIGTSLTVHPFASLAWRASDSTPRVLINMDSVGDLGHRRSDVVLLGKCDDIVVELAKELGWYDELVALWDETALDRKVDETKKDEKKDAKKKRSEEYRKATEEGDEEDEEDKDAEGEIDDWADGAGEVSLADAKAEVEKLASELQKVLDIKDEGTKVEVAASTAGDGKDDKPYIPAKPPAQPERDLPAPKSEEGSDKAAKPTESEGKL
ncbi:NAD-dependent deacetylase sirtuin-2 [Pluteus cervinus]|uniref:NAD-dependent deacetylase sirtuin-2 n=1 Tax=Pluteus cervinus TaxID=181527 RepID=A0ACD3B243_9AGAR|nr:NAD-dependent deacetylase sirtuin-2 [Pluteus cervinus]